MTLPADQNEHDPVFGLDDPYIEKLAIELGQFQPNFASDAKAPDRSSEIANIFTKANLSAYQQKELLSYMRYQWTVASGVANSLGFCTYRGYGRTFAEQLNGLILVQATLNKAQEALTEPHHG